MITSGLLGFCENSFHLMKNLDLELQLKVEKILYIKQKERIQNFQTVFFSLISPICVLQIVLRCSISLFA